MREFHLFVVEIIILANTFLTLFTGFTLTLVFEVIIIIFCCQFCLKLKQTCVSSGFYLDLPSSAHERKDLGFHNNAGSDASDQPGFDLDIHPVVWLLRVPHSRQIEVDQDVTGETLLGRHHCRDRICHFSIRWVQCSGM